MYDRRTVLALGAVALAGGVAGCGGSGPDPADGSPAGTAATPAGSDAAPRVEMTDGLRFEPAELTVGVGETVTWETTGTVAHSVTAYGAELPEGATYFASGGFDSEAAARESYPAEGSVGPGETYSHAFEAAGEFPYFCIPHESSMRGTITVEE